MLNETESGFITAKNTEGVDFHLRKIKESGGVLGRRKFHNHLPLFRFYSLHT
jgi:hypothetical protein